MTSRDPLEPNGPHGQSGPYDQSGPFDPTGPIQVGAEHDGGERLLHQPPNPSDLERSPPGSRDCARVRGLLRDYVDGDLGPTLVRHVDDHVHTCRVCAVELSRAEHEVLRLRRAFLPDRVKPAMPAPGFVGRVLERLVADEEAAAVERARETEVSPAVRARIAAAAIVPARADGAVRADGVGDGRADAGRALGRRSRELDFAVGSPAGMLVAGVFLLLLLGIGVRMFGSAEAAFDHAASMVVTWANNAFDGESNRLEIGDSVGDRGKLLVGADGVARVDWRDPSARTQPAASMELKGGEVRLEHGLPVLVQGRLDVLSKRDVEIPMLDGTRISLGAGEYIIAADVPVDMFDQGPLALQDDPLGSRPGYAHVEVAVLSGDPARITRPSGAVTLVAKGNVGVYSSGGGSVEVSGSGPIANVDRSPQPPGPATPPRPQVSGMALEASGMPTVMATVFLRSVVQGANGAGVDEIGFASTGSDGRFVISTSAVCERDFAVVFAAPNLLRNDLAIVPPQAVPLLRQNGQAQLERPLRFDYSAALVSSVVDEAGLPVEGVRVATAVVDEIFDVMWLLDQRAVTSATGSFSITQLPARLPAHQGLVALLLHDDYAVTCVPVPLRGDLAATAFTGPLRIDSLHNVKFAGLPPNSTHVVLQEVAGLPAGVVAARRTVTADFFGRVAPVPFGSGRMWLVDGQASELRELLADGQPSDVPRYLPATDSTPMSKQFRLLHPVGNSQLQVASSYRHDGLLLDRGADAASAPVLHVMDVQGHPVGDAQLFAVRDTGPRGSLDLRFVGFSNPQGAVPLAGVLPQENLVVIGTNRAIGWMAEPLLSGGNVTIELRPAGSVVLGSSLQPSPGAQDRAVALHFRRIGSDLLPGLRPVAVRFACDENGWQVSDVPAGDYLVAVGGHVFEVTVPPLGWVVVQ